MDTAEAEAIVLARGWLGMQPAGFRATFLGSTQLVEKPAGEPVFHAGDAPGGLYGVVTGGIGVSVIWGDAGPDLATILRSGTWFGHGPLLSGRARTLSFRAMEPSWLLHAPYAAMQDVLRQEPSAARSLGALADMNMDVAIATISGLLTRRGDRRIAATLVRISGDGAVDAISASQAELGEMANASRDLVNRVLARFRDAGWVTLGYNRIVIRNAAALRRYAAERD